MNDIYHACIVKDRNIIRGKYAKCIHWLCDTAFSVNAKQNKQEKLYEIIETRLSQL